MERADARVVEAEATPATGFREALLGLLYPRSCCACARRLPSTGEVALCPDCDDMLPRLVAPFCERCGEPFDGAIDTPFRCSNCSNRKLRFEFATAGFRSDDLVRELVHRFKYQRQQHLGAVLGRMLELGARTDERLAPGPWLMVPVPLHPRRRREREYNQAAEICRWASRRLGWPAADALQRTRYTVPQAHLDREDRLENLEGAFEMVKSRRLRRLVEGAEVAVVDDVLTTGATTSECARVLLEEGGASRVVALTLARG